MRLRNATILRVLSRPTGRTRHKLPPVNSCKEFAQLGSLVYVIERYLPRAAPPLTTIYRKTT